MDVTIHTRDRLMLTSASRLLETGSAIWIEFNGGHDRHFNPISDKFTVIANDRTDALRIAHGLRDAAAKLEAVYAPAAQPQPEPERPEPVPTLATRCARCGVTYQRPDGEQSRDGNPRCEECAEAFEEEIAAADAAEGHPCHREDQ